MNTRWIENSIFLLSLMCPPETKRQTERDKAETWTDGLHNASTDFCTAQLLWSERGKV